MAADTRNTFATVLRQIGNTLSAEVVRQKSAIGNENLRELTFDLFAVGRMLREIVFFHLSVERSSIKT